MNDKCKYILNIPEPTNKKVCDWYHTHTLGKFNTSVCHFPECKQENCPLKNENIKKETIKEMGLKEI